MQGRLEKSTAMEKDCTAQSQKFDTTDTELRNSSNSIVASGDSVVSIYWIHVSDIQAHTCAIVADHDNLELKLYSGIKLAVECTAQ